MSLRPESPPPPQDARFDRRRFLSLAALLPLSSIPARGGAPEPGPDSGSPHRSGMELERILAGRPDPGPDPSSWSAAETALLVRRGALSPEEVLLGTLDRIRRLDGVLRAFNAVDEGAVRAEARRIGRAIRAGEQLPLGGVPLAIKDNFLTLGLRTTANSWIFQDFVPGADAEVVRRLRAAGALVAGKTQMGPLATTRATTPSGRVTTRSAWAPRDPGVNPGGSSTGTATAIAARLVPAGTGTQTGGSITQPALAQGLTGLKPTMGRVSLSGVIPLSWTRDHPGPLARDSVDVALLLQTMAGPDPSDPRTSGHPPVPDFLQAVAPVERRGRPALPWKTRIGVLPDWPDTPERKTFLSTLASLGAELVEVELPPDWAILTSPELNNVRLVERAEPFLPWLRQDPRLFGSALLPWIHGLLLSGDEFLRGQRAKHLLLERLLAGLFSQVDLVVQSTPIPFDLLGLPLLAIPIGSEATPAGPRPIGALLGGAPWGEERLLAVASAWQRVTEWHRTAPPLWEPLPEDPPGPLPWWTEDPRPPELPRPTEPTAGLSLLAPLPAPVVPPPVEPAPSDAPPPRHSTGTPPIPVPRIPPELVLELGE